MASLIASTSVLSFTLLHDFNDGNPVLSSRSITSKILSRRAMISGLVPSCGSRSEGTIGSSCAGTLFWSLRSSGVSDVVSLFDASVAVRSVSWCSFLTIRAISSCSTFSSHFFYLNLAYLISQSLLTNFI